MYMCTRVDTRLLKHGRKRTYGEAAASTTVSSAWSQGRPSVSHPRDGGAEPSGPRTVLRALRPRPPPGPARPQVRSPPRTARGQGQGHVCCARAAPSAFGRATAQRPDVTPFVYLATCRHLPRNIRVFPVWGNHEELPESVPSGRDGVCSPRSLQEVERRRRKRVRVQRRPRAAGAGRRGAPAKRGAGSPRIAHRPALRARAAHLSRLCRCHAEHGHERRGRGGARARLPLTCLGSMAPARHVRAARRRSPGTARPAPAVSPPALRSAAASVGMGTAGSRRRERRAGGGAAAPVFTFVSREGPPRGREAGLGRPQVRPDRPVLSRAPNARIPRRAHGDRAPRRPPRAPQGNRG